MNSELFLKKYSIIIWTMMPEPPYAIEERLWTSAGLANVDEAPASRRLILLASCGDAATFHL